MSTKTKKTAKTIDYNDYLFTTLRDRKKALLYLREAIEDENPQVFLLALRNVAQANGGVTELAKKTGLDRVNLYRLLSKNGNPRLDSLNLILRSLGMRISFEKV
ncbi:MAG TPA: addiction module antidote protein [Candidatus Kapabacteria bacterium]